MGGLWLGDEDESDLADVMTPEQAAKNALS
jgi:hypothetical protein